MKKILVLSMLTCVALVCSCQKKDSLTQEQLAQRKVELDSRDEELAQRKNALDDREKALDEREQALAKKEEAIMNARTSPGELEAETADSAQMQAERDKAIQEFSAMVQRRSRLDSEKAKKQSGTQSAQKSPGVGDLQSQQQLGADELQKLKQRKLEATRMSPKPQ